MIEHIVPHHVAVAENAGEQQYTRLLMEEEAALGRVAPKRYREFAKGRDCAHRALAQLGVTRSPLVPGPNREPIWPSGFVGSITHCEGYAAAAVAPTTQIISIGIDAERAVPLKSGMVEHFAFEDEREWISASPHLPAEILVFSAKESLYKAWFPLTGAWLGFEDARVVFDEGSDRFSVRLLVPGPIIGNVRAQIFHGRYALTHGLVLTTVILACSAPPAREQTSE